MITPYMMKFYFIFPFLLTLKIYGQVPHDVKVYLDNKQVSQNAKDFYNGKFKATDDARTFSILDSLKTKNSLTRPFYIYLTSKMLDKADGSLSEELGTICKNFTEQYSDHVIDFLYSGKKLADKKYIDNWAHIIANEFLIDCEGQEKECLKKSMQTTLVKSRADNKSKLTDFYHKIERYCH
jgi:hypothetical protein